MPVALFDFS